MRAWLGTWKWAILIALLGVGYEWWTRAAPGPSPEARLTRMVVLFRMGNQEVGVVALPEYLSMSQALGPTDSVCVYRGNGEVLFDGVWSEFEAAVMDTVVALPTSRLPRRPE